MSAASAADVKEVSRALRARMLRVALLHLKQLDARAALMFESSGVFTRSNAEVRLPDDLLDIVGEANHPLRTKTELGPTVFYRDSAGRRLGIDMGYLLISDDARARKAAWDHFVALEPLRRICETTAEVLREVKAALLQDGDQWRVPALRAHSAVKSDILLALAGMRQGFAERYEDGLRQHIPALLEPAAEALEALKLQFTRPSMQRERIAELIREIALSSSSIKEKVEKYLESCGHLPLADGISLAALLRHIKLDQHAFREIWFWSRTRNLDEQLHFCLAALQNPTWIADDIESEVASVFEMCFPDSGDQGDKRWARFELRGRLARHYAHYLALQAPGVHGEAIAVWSWWLAARVAAVFDDFPNELPQFMNVGLVPADRHSAMAIRLIGPRMETGSLYAVSSWLGSPWTMAAWSSISIKSLGVIRDHLQPRKESLEQRMTTPLMFGFPFNAVQPGSETYVYEPGIATAIEAWTTVFGESDRTRAWRELNGLYTELADPQAFAKKHSVLGDLDPVTQMIVASAASALAARNALPLDAVWKDITNDKWRRGVFGNVTPHCLEVLVVAWLQSIHVGDEQWQFGLPHALALACEEAEGKEERKDLLFALLACACSATYSVSALRRVMTGSRKQEFADAAREWIELLKEFNVRHYRWVAARARALRSAMAWAS